MIGTVVIDEHDVTVLHGDAREQLETLPGGSVNCVVTSPPYFGLRDYGVDGQLGLEASPSEYVSAMVAVFAEVRRVLADDGVLWLNLGDSYSARADASAGASSRRDRTNILPPRISSGVASKNMLGIPWRVAFALQDDGWILRNAVVWNKPNAMPESVTDRLSCRYEHVFLFSRSLRYWFDLDAIKQEPGMSRNHMASSTRKYVGLQGGKGSINQDGWTVAPTNPGDVWAIATSPFPGAHFATMPMELAKRCILAGCPDDGLVLDPFAGSGTTLMAARKLARKSVGIELNAEYIDIIRQRIGQTPFDFGEPA